MTERLIKSHKIRIGDISISYHIKKAQTSSTKVILFLHGFPFNKNMWRQQLDALDADTTGIAIDIRGHGNTTSGHGFFSIDVFAKDLRVFIEKLGIEQAVLCGISMGGYIALRAYELFPEKINGLILCDTHSKADDDTAKQKRFDSIQAVLNHGRRPFSIGFIERVFSKDSKENNSDAVELIKSSIRRNSINSICSTLLALAARTDTTAVLEKIQIPTLLIRGKEDIITNHEDMVQLYKTIKDAEFVEMERCGHLPNLENPEHFNRLMLEFLKKL
ncbi:alpha/beta fold hydrolase [Sphingobacterium wenxiniae]|uniref:Pimeloyl-ACP methyl ester carboxylesterase n=1 Tax=Sphingobacterium wenxiniae TaxID=683125 RepID=A0A1I6P8V9_9SPHI|nr:alpha/beta fold hydrolase [Sphingobacterium wenxiniae]SFS36606.1 Pimeloyl-ACP methyl ester carboxylesterase [Sphingobacterium wenxiniae]